MGRTSAPRRRVAVLSTDTRRWSRRGREVLLGKQDLPKSATAPKSSLIIQLTVFRAVLVVQLSVAAGEIDLTALNPCGGDLSFGFQRITVAHEQRGVLADFQSPDTICDAQNFSRVLGD